MRTGALSPERCRATPARAQGGHLVFCMLLMTVAAFAPKIAIADEGGASFWLPGTFGSFAAVPAEPGWSAETVYYHSSTTAAANVAVAREIEIGRFTPTLNATLSTRLKSSDDQFSFSPIYTFATPLF